MNKLIYALPLMALMACEEEKHVSRAPIFSGFRAVSASAEMLELKGNKLTPNDSIIISAVQETKGEYIYHADYTWTVTYNNYETGQTRVLPVRYTRKVTYDVENSDPVVRFRLPDTIGEIKVNFEAVYQYSSASVTEVEGTKGGITVSSSSLMGRAIGSKNYSVQK